MAKLKIHYYPDKVLARRAEPVTVFGPELEKLSKDMLETMEAHEGVGLAAPQVGVSKRMVALDAGEERGHPFVILNPEILESSGKSVREEGCLSFPGIYGKIERPEKVKVRAMKV